MILGELIKYLKAAKEKYNDAYCTFGFGEAGSYRGYYEDIAFDPKIGVRLSEMIKSAEEANGKTFGGYKGGSYTMNLGSRVWIAEYGTSSTISEWDGDGLQENELYILLGLASHEK